MIRKARNQDLSLLAGFAVKLFGDTLEVQRNEIENFLRCDDVQFFICFEDEIPVGFAQVQLRYDYVEGTSSSPVGYLEGIFIEKEYRIKGYAEELLSECELWAKEKGCTEFAGDCEIGNETGILFHKAMNFSEVNRIVCFKKELSDF